MQRLERDQENLEVDSGFHVEKKKKKRIKKADKMFWFSLQHSVHVLVKIALQLILIFIFSAVCYSTTRFKITYFEFRDRKLKVQEGVR